MDNLYNRRFVAIGILALNSGCELIQDVDAEKKSAVDNYNYELQLNRNLTEEAVSLRQKLADDIKTLSQLQHRQEDLRRGLENLQNNPQQVDAYIKAIDRRIRDINLSAAKIVGYSASIPPNNPDAIAIQRHLSANKAAARAQIESNNDVLSELEKLWLGYIGSVMATRYFEETLLPKLTRILAIDTLDPEIGFALTVHDIYEFYEKYNRTQEIVRHR